MGNREMGVSWRQKWDQEKSFLRWEACQCVSL